MVEATTKTREFEFELVAPEKIEVASMEERVTLPGEMGDFMVMIGHTPLLAGLRAGVVTIHRHDHNKQYFITGGFADVGNEHCTILTPHAIAVINLDAEKLSREIEKTHKSLAEAKEKHEQEHLHEQLQILHMKLDAVRKYSAVNAH